MNKEAPFQTVQDILDKNYASVVIAPVSRVGYSATMSTMKSIFLPEWSVAGSSALQAFTSTLSLRESLAAQAMAFLGRPENGTPYSRMFFRAASRKDPWGMIGAEILQCRKGASAHSLFAKDLSKGKFKVSCTVCSDVEYLLDKKPDFIEVTNIGGAYFDKNFKPCGHFNILSAPFPPKSIYINDQPFEVPAGA